MSPDERPHGIPVAFRTLGCKVNRVESDQIAVELIGKGARLVPEDEAAVVVINTCTVTGEADAKARKAVRHALNAVRRPIVVVTGCLAAIDAPGLAALDERVIAEPDKTAVALRVAETLGLDETPHDAQTAGLAVGDGFRTRAAIKIEDGCDNFCTYCIVPYARGVPRSVELDLVVRGARELVDAGVAEVVLTGINIGRYRDGDADLADVVRAVAATGVSRLRISSIEPPDVTPELISAITQSPAVCEHLHVPLQSGSDAVLSRMGRAYTTREYEQRIDALRAAIPGVAVTTDVIAGFPGETDEEHEASCSFVRRMGFAKLHVFRYSPRPGTPAAALPQVDPSVRAARAEQLRILGQEARLDFIGAREGAAACVLIESVDGDSATGTTRDYLRVTVCQHAARVGDEIVVTLRAESCR